ncbi:MAG: protocatechuate 3,4-dioxygenase subunit alpha [Pseudomonadota bacterium]
MTKHPFPLRQTASQTAGPYVHIGLAPGAAGFASGRPDLGAQIIGPDTKGTRIRVEGCAHDGAGAPIPDAMIEIWQADADGRHVQTPAGPQDPFRGWGRVVADFQTGAWAFETIKPGPSVDPAGQMHAPHINLWLVARGINMGLHTRLYFDDEVAANDADPVLQQIKARRRATLLARRQGQRSLPAYRFDIHLQGDAETVFFEG